MIPPADLSPTLTATASDSGSMFPTIRAMADRADFPQSFLNPRFKSVSAHRTETRKLVFNEFRYSPPRVPHNAEVLARVELDGGIIAEKILFSTTPDLRVPAYFLLPKDAADRGRRLPAIIDLHSHGGMFLFGKEKVIDFGAGRNHPAMVDYHKGNYESRPTATELVKRGYAVLTIDTFGFGERRILMDEDLTAGADRARYTIDDVRRLNQKNRQKESTIVKSLAYAGINWPALVATDDIRSVDYLVTRPEIDASRIGCVGVSMGGYRSLLLAGLDERIRAACVTGFMSTVKPMIQRHMDTHSFVHFIPGVHRLLDLPDIVALRAPLPLMVQQCRKDGLFPLAGMEESLEKISAIYRKAGAADRFTGKFYDVPHIFNIEMQDDAFAFFDRHLKGA